MNPRQDGGGGEAARELETVPEEKEEDKEAAEAEDGEREAAEVHSVCFIKATFETSLIAMWKTLDQGQSCHKQFGN